VKTFSLTAGELVINTTDATKYALPKSFKVKITISLPESTTSLTNAVWLFGITIQHKCSYNKIALDGTTYANSNSGTAVSDFTYTIGTASVSKKPLISAV
jgi:hypothetical protein